MGNNVFTDCLFCSVKLNCFWSASTFIEEERERGGEVAGFTFLSDILHHAGSRMPVVAFTYILHVKLKS